MLIPSYAATCRFGYNFYIRPGQGSVYMLVDVSLMYPRVKPKLTNQAIRGMSRRPETGHTCYNIIHNTDSESDTMILHAFVVIVNIDSGKVDLPIANNY